MNEQLQAIATVLSLVNPAICAAIFSKLESGRPTRNRVADGLKAMIAVLVILVLAAFFGTKTLQAFGISLDAFSVAGGFVLAWMGFGMLKGDDPGGGVSSYDHPGSGVSLTPLILFAASPGTITGVITLAVAHSRDSVPVTALMAILVAVIVTTSIIMFVTIQGRKQQGGFFRDTLTRFLGLIVIAMGVQFALTGFKSFMN